MIIIYSDIVEYVIHLKLALFRLTKSQVCKSYGAGRDGTIRVGVKRIISLVRALIEKTERKNYPIWAFNN